MKKILLSFTLVLFLAVSNRAVAQCNGASVSVTNFAVLAPGNQVLYSFDWTFVGGNASIQVVDSCNGAFDHFETCIPRLHDSAAGVHHVTGSFPTSCSGALTVAVLIWTNPTCGGTSCVAVSRTISHTPLPVSFQSFTATRNRSAVVLSWGTSSEMNNRGFAVERNIDGNWQQVGWVNSRALNGSSDAALNYSFTDPNDIKGISQYRIRQEDIDSKSKYTEIRSVRGDGQVGKITIYPNPTTNGKVNVVFDDASVVRNVTVLDINGRTVKEFRAVSNNNLTISDLQPGMYTVKVAVPATGEQNVQKIVVNKR
jgi:hypothetical protein